LERALCDYIRYILQRELKSLTWLRQLNRGIVTTQTEALDKQGRGR
jgi:hypothetical protein